MQALGYQEFVDEVSAVYENHKAEAAVCRAEFFSAAWLILLQEKPKGTRKLESLGIPEEVLLQNQQALFAKARTELRKSQEASTAAAAIAAAHASAANNAAAANKKDDT